MFLLPASLHLLLQEKYLLLLVLLTRAQDRQLHGNGLLEMEIIQQDQNPVHTYNKTGLYSVTLTASNENGSNALTKSSYIAVSNSLVAAFSASQLQDLYRLVSVLLTRALDHQLHGNGLLEMETLQQKRILYTYTIKRDNILLV